MGHLALWSQIKHLTNRARQVVSWGPKEPNKRYLGTWVAIKDCDVFFPISGMHTRQYMLTGDSLEVRIPDVMDQATQEYLQHYLAVHSGLAPLGSANAAVQKKRRVPMFGY